MTETFHRLVRRDLREALDHYETEGGAILADRFFAEVENCVLAITTNPNRHFSDGGYRRHGLDSFPYHFLFEVGQHGIWIAVLRHDRRHWSYGLRRLKRDQ